MLDRPATNKTGRARALQKNLRSYDSYRMYLAWELGEISVTSSFQNQVSGVHHVRRGKNLCSLVVIVWFLKMIVSFWVKQCSCFLLFNLGLVFQHVSFHFLGVSFHAKIETWRGGGRSEQRNML